LGKTFPKLAFFACAEGKIGHNILEAWPDRPNGIPRFETDTNVNSPLKNTERDQASDALHESEERYRSLVELTQDAVLIVVDDRIRYCNPAGLRLSGASSLDEILNQPVENFNHPEEREKAALRRRKLLESKEPLPAMLFRLRRCDGGFVEVESSMAMCTYQGRPAIQMVLREATDRLLAERALKQSEERFRAIFEAEPQCIKLVAADGSLLEMNSAGLGMIAAPKFEEVKGHCVFELVVPENRDEYMSFHRSICAGAKGTLEFEMIALDGTRRHMYSHAVPFHLGPNKTAALSITLDMTERRRGEEALRLSEVKYRTMFDNAVEGIFQTTPEGRFLTLNVTLAHLYGFETPAEAVAHFQNVGEQLYVDPNRRKEFVRQIELQGAIKGFEFQIRRQNGRLVWLRESARAVYDSAGKIVCYEGTVEDITERKLTEKALLESEERYRLVVEGSLQGILIHQDGYIRYANEALARMFDYDGPEELIGRPLWETFVHPESLQVLARRTQEILDGLPTPPHPGWRATGKHGREIWVATAASRIDLNGQGAVVAFYLDITERVRAEEERKKLEAQFHHSQKLESLGVLAGGIAHDFNNLLTAMLGYASLARLSLPDDSRAGSMLEEIEKAGQRAAELAQLMLAYSGKGKFVLDVLELDHLVQEMARLLETVVSKKATLHLDLRSAKLQGDPTQIRQVVMNLITNASDALGGQPGEIVMRTGVRSMNEADLRSPFSPDLLPAGTYSFVEIKDSGCGMSEETLSKIFDPFFTTKFTGRGLGLAAVLGIVRGHKGTILVESTLGGGTTFQIYFPSFVGKTIELADNRPSARRAKACGTILVVEDEDSIRHFVSTVLKGDGYTVLPAADGKEGMQVYQEHHREISLILLDLTMPQMGGIEVLKQLRDRPSAVPVVLMSGFSEVDTSAQSTGLGANGFLQKPFQPMELLAAVRQHCC